LHSLDIEREQVDVASGKGMGYKYFGAAKQLPGVKELFELPPELKKKRSRYEMYKRIDADYYGYRDDEDGILEKLEQVAEKQMRAQAIEEWQQIEAVKNEARKGVKSGEVTLSPLLFLHTFLIAIEFNVVLQTCFVTIPMDSKTHACCLHQSVQFLFFLLGGIK
jgi:hypothetical protein